MLAKGGNLYAAEPRMQTPMPITVPQGMTGTPIEASGIYLDSVSGLYIVVSDETDNKQPVFFMMDGNGVVRAKKVISGVPEINDLESVTQGPDGCYYFLTSQSHNRKGKLAAGRKRLLRVSRDSDGEFQALGSVSPYDLLSQAAAVKPQAQWARFFLDAVQDKSVDIEGCTFHGDTLLLGFKDPKLQTAAVILGVRTIKTLFNSGTLDNNDVFIWNTLSLYDSLSGCFCGVADLYMHSNGLLVGTATGVAGGSGVHEDVGMVWKYDCRTGDMKIVRHFPGLKPEGITFDGLTGEYCIVFDNGSKNPSYYMKVKAPL